MNEDEIIRKREADFIENHPDRVDCPEGNRVISDLRELAEEAERT